MNRRGLSRRASLAAVAPLAAVSLLPLAGCGDQHRPAEASPASRPPAAAPRASIDPAKFRALERKHRARLGLFAVDTGSGATVAYRANERFAFCSVFKPLAAAAVLDRYPVGHLEKRVPVTAADVNSISPVAQKRIGSTMTIRELADAAIRFSDGTAGNKLVQDIGGPARLTAYLRSIGDPATRMDDLEPGLNRVPPGDPRDTTTPRAIVGDLQRLVLGDALPAEKRGLLKDWLLRATVVGGNRIPAALPKGWTIAHKTGSGDYGRGNDVAVLWPPRNRPPLVLGILTERAGYSTPLVEPLLAEAAGLAITALR